MKISAILTAIFITALSLRVVFVFLYKEGELRQNKLAASDAQIYDSLAANLSSGLGYAESDGRLTARREPLYPLFLSFFYRLLGRDYFRIRIIQCLLGAGLCLVIFFVAQGLFGVKAGLISSSIAAFYYPFIQLSGYLMPENLAILSLSLFVLVTVKAVKGKSLPIFWLSGLFFGLAVLSRGSLLPFLALISLWFWVLYRKKVYKFLAVFILGFILALSPWVVRNFIVFKKFIPATTRIGDVLYQGYNPLAKGGVGGWWPMEREYVYPEEADNLDEIKRSQFLLREAGLFIIKNPGKALALNLRKAANMWRPFYTPTSFISKIVMLSSYGPIVILGFIGMIKTGNLRQPAFLLHLLILYYFLIHAFLVATIRYRWPVMPFIIILAGFILNRIIEDWSR